MHAKRAYHEWIPIRAVDLSDESRIWREFQFGDLLTIAALDTRKYDRGELAGSAESLGLTKHDRHH